MHEASAIYRLEDGNDGLAKAIAEDTNADIRLNAPVTAVRHDSDGATVTYGDGQEIQATKVVITLPQNMLHKLDVQPALSEGKLAPAGKRPPPRASRPGSGSRDPSSRSSPTPPRTSRSP